MNLSNRLFVLLTSFAFLFIAVTATVSCGGRDSSLPQPSLLWDGESKEEGIKDYLAQLCSERMEGREGGKKGEAEAALYLARFLQIHGLQPAGDEDTFFQSFAIDEYGPVLNGTRIKMEFKRVARVNTSENILGVLEGKSKDIVVLSAHYDHLGIIGRECYQGANDNASGVAVVMEVVKQLAEEQPACTLLFAFWGSEEKGLLGSNFFCLHPTVPMERIRGIINLDTVGNLKTDHQLLGWQEKEGSLIKKLATSLEEEGWQINWQERGDHNSDHWPFAKKGIPGFTLLSPSWLTNNHTPQDIPERINVVHLQSLAESLAAIFR